MIRVTVELWPGGREARAREIARMDIANVSDLAQTSDYGFRASSVANQLSGQPALVVRGTVEGHRRDQSIWALIAKTAGRVAASVEK